MASRRRPRIEKAAQVDTGQLGSVQESDRLLVEALPELMKAAIAEAKQGNNTILGKLLDIYRDMSKDAEMRRSNETLDRIREIQEKSIERVRGLSSQSGSDLGSAGRAGAEHAPPGREAGDLVTADDSSGED